MLLRDMVLDLLVLYTLLHTAAHIFVILIIHHHKNTY